MTSLALEIFHRCLEQVEEIEVTASRAELEGFATVAPILRRSAYVLAVAALDSYFHERAVDLLRAKAISGATEAAAVANYIQNATASDVSGPQGENYIRLRLSFKTLVGPTAIDKMLEVSGKVASDCWLNVAFRLTTRPDRLRRLQEVVYDRRNLIAHEGDWDLGQLEFRIMEKIHLIECVNHVRGVAQEMDAVL